MDRWDFDSACITVVLIALLGFAALVITSSITKSTDISARTLDMRKAAIASGKCEALAPGVLGGVTFGPCR